MFGRKLTWDFSIFKEMTVAKCVVTPLSNLLMTLISSAIGSQNRYINETSMLVN